MFRILQTSTGHNTAPLVDTYKPTSPHFDFPVYLFSLFSYYHVSTLPYFPVFHILLFPCFPRFSISLLIRTLFPCFPSLRLPIGWYTLRWAYL